MYTVVLMAALSGSPATPSCYGYHGAANHSIAAVSDGKVLVLNCFTHMVHETAQRSVTVKGKDGKERQETQTYTIMKPVQNQAVMAFELDKVRAVDAAGKPITSLASRLAQPTRVLTVHDTQSLDSAWRSILKENVVVLILPPMVPQPAMAPPPPGSPPAKTAPPKPPEFPKHNFALPKAPAPGVGSASLDNQGRLVLQQSGGYLHTMTGYYEKTNNGTVEKVPVQMEVNNFHMTQTTVDARAVKAFDVAGKDVPLGQRLRGSRNVLLAPTGQVDPYYMEVFRNDVLIIAPPVMGHGHIGAESA